MPCTDTLYEAKLRKTCRYVIEMKTFCVAGLVELHIFCQLLQDLEHSGPWLVVHLHLQGCLKGEQSFSLEHWTCDAASSLKTEWLWYDSNNKVTLQVDLNRGFFWLISCFLRYSFILPYRTWRPTLMAIWINISNPKKTLLCT